MNEIKVSSKPRRAQGGMGLLSRTISVQNPQVSIPLIPREEREEVEKKEEEKGARREAMCCSGRREKERERVRGFLTPTTLNPKD